MNVADYVEPIETLYPIQGVPFAVKFAESCDYGLEYSPLRTLPRSTVERLAQVVKNVWMKIPIADQAIMTSDMAKYRNRSLTLFFIQNWTGQWFTNGYIDAVYHGKIAIDLGYAQWADDEHLSATIGHELAHYRDFAYDNDSDLIEETAIHFAEKVWGFAGGEVIYKCDACRFMDSVLFKEGISGSVFWDVGLCQFIYFQETQRIRLGSSDYEMLHDEAFGSLCSLLCGGCDVSFLSGRIGPSKLTEKYVTAYLNEVEKFKSPFYWEWRRDTIKGVLQFLGTTLDDLDIWLRRSFLRSSYWDVSWKEGISKEEMIEWGIAVLA